MDVNKIWLKSYPPGVPADINADAYQSLIDIFESSCKNHKDRPAYYNLGVTLTYAQLDEYSRRFAAYLQQELKLKKGDRFALMLPNVLQYPIALYGAMRAGLVIVNVNPLYTPDELTHQLKDAGAVAILVMTNFANTLEKSLPCLPALKHIIVTKLGDLFNPLRSFMMDLVLKYYYKKIPAWQLPNVLKFNDVLKQGSNTILQPVSVNNEDTAFLQYTGGTTGVAKGAVLTHRNIIANIMQVSAWFKGVIREGEEIIITALPLYHIFSLTANCIFFTKIGSLNVLITNPRDIPNMVKEMGKFKFTGITGVNTLFAALLNNAHFAKLDFSQMRISLGGGMAVQHAVAEKWQKVTGVPLLEAYGLTETSPCVTINPPNLKAYNGTIGLPVPSTDLCFFDNDGNEVPFGQPGEIAVKGPQVMNAYWHQPEETKKVFHNGWLLTGDIGEMDEQGFVRLLERKKDMILVSGFNVYPSEIEAVIAEMPGVKEEAVVGVIDEHSGEVVKAFIVKKDSNLTEAEVIKFCRQHLTSYKIPKQVEFVDELPKTNVGKILRRALRDQKEESHIKGV